MTEDILFHEVQHSRQWWLWLLVVVVTAASWYSFVNQVVLGGAVGDHPASNLLISIIWFLAGVAFPVFFIVLRLEVTVRSDRIDIRYFPLFRRSYPANGIEKAYARVYRPLAEYGGWGVRWSPANGWAYNTGGNTGVQLQLTSGKKLLIGSQRAEELQKAIAAMMSKRKNAAGPAGTRSRRKGKRK